jgi:hypothetical protein
MRVPQSSADTKSRSGTSPVLRATSTTATCAPNGYTSWGAEEVGGLEPGVDVGGQLVAVRARGDLGQRHRARRGALHLVAAVGEHDILGRRLQQHGGDSAHLLLHGPGGAEDGRAPTARLRLPPLPLRMGVLSVSPWRTTILSKSTPSWFGR